MDNEQQYKLEIASLEWQNRMLTMWLEHAKEENKRLNWQIGHGDVDSDLNYLKESLQAMRRERDTARQQSLTDAQIARKAEARTVEMQQRMHNFETQVEAVKKLYGDQAWEDAGQHVRLLTQVMRLNERIEYLEREREKDAQILVLIHNKTGARLGYEDYDDDSDDDDEDNDSDDE